MNRDEDEIRARRLQANEMWAGARVWREVDKPGKVKDSVGVQNTPAGRKEAQRLEPVFAIPPEMDTPTDGPHENTARKEPKDKSKTAETEAVRGEREVMRGPLSAEVEFRLLMKGDLGAKEIANLVRLLELQKELLFETGSFRGRHDFAEEPREFDDPGRREEESRRGEGGTRLGSMITWLGKMCLTILAGAAVGLMAWQAIETLGIGR